MLPALSCRQHALITFDVAAVRLCVPHTPITIRYQRRTVWCQVANGRQSYLSDHHTVAASLSHCLLFIQFNGGRAAELRMCLQSAKPRLGLPIRLRISFWRYSKVPRPQAPGQRQAWAPRRLRTRDLRVMYLARQQGPGTWPFHNGCSCLKYPLLLPKQSSVFRLVSHGQVMSGAVLLFMIGTPTWRSTNTRLGTKAEDGWFFHVIFNRLHAVFICFVSNTNKRIIIMDVSVTIHGRQYSTTPGHEIPTTWLVKSTCFQALKEQHKTLSRCPETLSRCPESPPLSHSPCLSPRR